jgi:ferredoxin
LSEAISKSGVEKLVNEWIGGGRAVAAPVSVHDRLYYRRVSSAAEMVLNGGRPGNSIKQFLVPRHERLFTYRVEGKRTALAECDPQVPETVILGARPCQAAALPILDHVFNWDYRDERYNLRRERTTVVSLACHGSDEACFCTSVGGGPDHPAGSDAMLLELGDGNFEVRTFTERGRALFAGRTRESSRTAEVAAVPERALEIPEFSSPVWAERSLACLGCGACAYTCPTCHCFDMADEGGARVKNWDSCQFPLFTLHASGHNPRPNQAARQRQRVLHKFRIYPEKFGATLCTGCGNCTRNCPVGLGILGMLA